MFYMAFVCGFNLLVLCQHCIQLLRRFFARFGLMLHIICFYVSWLSMVVMWNHTHSNISSSLCKFFFEGFHLFLMKFFCFAKFYIFPRAIIWDLHLVFFSSRRFFPKGNLNFLFKCSMFFIIHFIWWEKQLGKGLNPRPLG
jgi:hypothetical protein